MPVAPVDVDDVEEVAPTDVGRDDVEPVVGNDEEGTDAGSDEGTSAVGRVTEVTDVDSDVVAYDTGRGGGDTERGGDAGFFIG